MKRLRSFFWLALLGVLVVPAHIALAKGPPHKISLTGPGLAGEVEVTDRKQIEELGMAEFENVNLGPVDAPQVEGGYEITRYYQDERGTYHAFDKVRYYPLPSGQPGYVFYVGIVNGSGPYDGKWYRATLRGDKAMRRVLIQLGVTLPEAVTISRAGTLPWQYAAISATGAAIALAGWLVYRARTQKMVIGSR